MKDKENPKHITAIGGQAVIEGVMMKGPKDMAIAVRKPDGEIEIKKEPVPKAYSSKFLKLPIIRGVAAFVQSLIIGVGSLMYSAEFYDIEEEGDYKPSKFELFLEKTFGENLKTAVIYFSVALSLVLGTGLFMILPVAVVDGVKFLFGIISGGATNAFTDFFSANSRVIMNVSEGILRIGIFLIYLMLVSKMEDIKRVFEYHGAEHKSIACYEAEDELTVENVKKHSRLHPRCGTSFLLIVMVMSIILFSFITSTHPIMKILLRLAFLPLVAGLSYEIIKFTGKSKSKVATALTKPGMMLQLLTTREPDDKQIEVAIASLQSVLTGNKEEDKW